MKSQHQGSESKDPDNIATEAQGEGIIVTPPGKTFPPLPGGGNPPVVGGTSGGSGDSRYLVTGIVRDANGNLVHDAPVSVFQQLLRQRSPQALATGKTLLDGSYEIRYLPPQNELGVIVDFAIVVTAANTKQVDWLVSPVVYRAQPFEQVNLMEGGAYRESSRYTLQFQKIQTVTSALPLTELTDNDKQQDIHYLSQQTDSSQQDVMLMVMAAHLSESTKIAPEHFYALFSQQVPKSLPNTLLEKSFQFTAIPQLTQKLLRGIFATKSETLIAALTKAVDENIVPPWVSGTIPNTVKALTQLRLQAVLTQTNRTGKASLGSLLSITTVPPAQYPLFATLYDQYNGTSKLFWEALQKQTASINEVQAKDLRLTLDIGKAIKNHLPLLKVLKQSFARGQFTSVGNLATLTVDQWAQFIQTATTGTEKGFPDTTDGKNDAEKIKTYATILAQRLEQNFPTDALSGSISRNQSIPAQERTDLVRFFANNQSLDLRKVELNSYLQDNKSTALSGIQNPTVTLQNVKSYQRALQLAPTATIATILKTNDLTSAQKIYTMGKSNLTQVLTNAQVEAGHIDQIYATSELKYSLLLARMLEYNLSLNSNGPASVLPPITANIIETQQITQNFPSLQGIFGSVDFCDCQDCQSVYSPSAYLVDILHFLRSRRSKIANVSVKDLLLQRRADLGEVDLTCENTNIALPFIDLVNEILEEDLAPSPIFVLPANLQTLLTTGPINSTVLAEFVNQHLPCSPDAQVTTIIPNTIWQIQDAFTLYTIRKESNLLRLRKSRQTLDTAEHLKAHPAYVNDAAYEKLRLATFPISLPFNLLWEEANTYLEHLGISRADLMRSFQNKNVNPVTPDDLVIAGEVFGLNRDQRTLILTSNPANQNILWGVNNPLTDLANVAVFLKQAGLLQLTGQEYHAFLSLFTTKFVNPAGADNSVIIRGAEECATDQQSITNLSLPKLDRANRFLRLWPQTPWTMWELDLLIRAPLVGNGQLDALCLQQLARFQDLQNRLHLPVESILAFYQPLNSELRLDSDPLYTQVFLNKAVVSPVNLAFEISKVTNPNTTDTLSSQRATIQAALLMSEEDFNLLLPLTDGKLTRTNLSVLYRYITLANAFKLKVKSLFLLLKIGNVAQPFASIAQTLQLIELAQFIQKGKITLDQLSYLLSFNPTSSSALAENTITQNLIQLRANLQKTADSLGTTGNVIDQVLITLSETLALQFNIDVQAARYVLNHVPLHGTLLLNIFSDATFLSKTASGAYSKEITPTNFADMYLACVRLHKISIVIATYKLSADDFQWLLAHASAYSTKRSGNLVNGLDFAQLPVQGSDTSIDISSWRAFVDLITYNNSYAEQNGLNLFSIIEHLGNQAATLSDLSTWAQWNQTSLTNIQTQLGLQYPQDFHLVETYSRLSLCMSYLSTLGVNVGTLSVWLTDTLTRPISDQIKQTVKSHYQQEQWLTISATLQDTIREKKRAALVAYELAHPKPVNPQDLTKGFLWHDSASLFAYFLIDVEMSACQVTSRIVQATNSIQLFVQRCFLNLEANIVVDAQPLSTSTFFDDDWLQWKWMKNYRLWEANRKVFLYPENWIEPELRLDKSPFFEELESDLHQAEITNEYVEEVFLRYVEKLDAVARLDVCGVYHHVATGIDELHVIARTRGIPHIYYYRKWVNQAMWTAWGKIDLDIPGDHAVPVVYNRKLYLFWLVFSEKPEPRQAMPNAQASNTPPPQTKKYLEIQIAWSIYRRGKWSGKTLSKAVLPFPYAPPSKLISMKAFEDTQNNLMLELYLDSSKEFNNGRELDTSGNPTGAFLNPFPLHSETRPPGLIAHFIFNGDVIRINAVSSYFGVNVQSIIQDRYGEAGQAIGAITTSMTRSIPTGAHYSNNTLTNNVDTPPMNVLDVVVLDAQLRNGESVLSNLSAVTPYHVAHDIQNPTFTLYSPFFFSDTTRGYFVTTSLTGYRTQYVSSSQTIQIPDNYSYYFHDFYHPYTKLFLHELNRLGISGLLSRKIQVTPEKFGIPALNTFTFDSVYSPQKPYVIADNQKEIVDFSFPTAYSLYNWELFFHVPLMIAERLSQNQRFEEALQWFHYIFDPTNPVEEEAPKKYWITKPFYNANKADYQNQRIENLLKNVNAKLTDYLKQIAEWRDHPFDPHLIARFRTVAYQWTVVMKYINTVIAWGDQLFRQDTREDINLATQLYLIAAEILGPQPIKVPSQQQRLNKNYNELEKDLDAFSNVLEDYENAIVLPGDQNTTSGQKIPPIHMFFFAIPANQKLLGYWDTVADRLFKIRHCLNIEGVTRPLALFAPPIDPGLLVRALANGVDLGNILSNQQIPLFNYRFPAMIQRVKEFCRDVQALGSLLLGILEKQDAEALVRLRVSQEITLLQASVQIRQQEVDAAGEDIEGLENARASIDFRRQHYSTLIKTGLISPETTSLNLMKASTIIDTLVATGYVIAGGLALIPKFVVGMSGFGGTPQASASTGGPHFSRAAEAAALTLGALSRVLEKGSQLSTTIAGYDRRFEEWAYQSDQAANDLKQLDKQISAATIRYQIAQNQQSNLNLQIKQAQDVDSYLHDKFNNADLYDWMVTQVSTVYFQSYQMVYDLARRVEKAYQYETGQYESNIVQFGYWDSLKKGLLAADRLALDLHRLEMTYLDQNKREYELTKHISLARLDPVRLMEIKANGSCTINLPEFLFDLDFPGHYMRRIKSVSLSIPCVVGPYTNINATLTLLNNSVRVNTQVGGGYDRLQGNADDRFRDQIAATQSIATSHAQDDSGLFELNFQDERYLPFEGAGAISQWRLDLPLGQNQFDLATITDIILHVKYTAREGGAGLHQAASAAVQAALPKGGAQIIDLRGEYPTEWYRFLFPEQAGGEQLLTIPLSIERFPFLVHTKTLAIQSIELIAAIDDTAPYDLRLIPPSSPTETITLTQDQQFSKLYHTKHAAPNAGGYTLGSWSIQMKPKQQSTYTTLIPEKIHGLYLIVTYTTNA